MILLNFSFSWNRFLQLMAPLLIFLLLAPQNNAEELEKPYTFSNKTTASAEDVNANFDLLYDEINRIIGHIFIDADNNFVGIGKEFPAAELDVDGTIRAKNLCNETGNNCQDLSAALPDSHSLNASDGNPVDQIYVDEKGHVGINTTSPLSQLDVSVGTGSTTTLSTGLDESQTEIILTAATDFPPSGTIIIDSEVITYSGIDENTLSGASRGKLGTSASVHSNGAVVSFVTLIVSRNKTTVPLLIGTNEGKVGIGTATPATELEVSGTIKANAFSGAFTGSFSGDGSGLTNLPEVSSFSDDSVVNSDIKSDAAIDGSKIAPDFGSQNIRTTGNVGIGTSSPSARMEVKSTGSSSASAGLNVTDADGDSRLYVRDDGKVGIGTTTPAAALDVSGNLHIGNSASGYIGLNDDIGEMKSYLQLSGGGLNIYSDAQIDLSPGNSQAVRVDSSGNVGIGTTIPGSELDVKGTLRLSGLTSGYVGLAPAAAAGSTTYTLPSADGSPGYVMTTDGAGILSWANVSSVTADLTLSNLSDPAVARTNLGLGSVENTALSTWSGTGNITTFGTISTGIWQGTAINATYIDVLPAAKITSGTLDNARINWESPGTIGSTTPSPGSFSTVTATTFSGSGASLTNLPAGNLTTGIVSTARYSALADLIAEGAPAGITTTKIGYLDDVTSAIQAQIVLKSPSASPTFTGDVTMPATGIWNSSGNVGIGTTGPGSELDVKGTLRLSGSTSGYVGLAPAAAAGGTTYTLPNADGSSGNVLTTDGSAILSWTDITSVGADLTLSNIANAATARTNLGLGSVENTALSTWSGTGNITTLGIIGSGNWQGTAINATYIDVLPAAKITSGTLDNARINWESPGTIGSTTPAAGSFSTVTATTFSGSGASLTNLPAGNLTTGIVSTARYSALADLIAEGAPAGITTAKIGYLDDVTGAIQAQIVLKSPSASPTFTGDVTMPATGIWNSSGNVGIGTTGPGSELDVKGTLRLSGSTSGYVGLAPAAAAGGTTYTLPNADGSSGNVLTTDGSAILSWTDITSVGADLTLSNIANAATARTNLGLGSVENTALSTWSGTSNITTLGIIGSGNWQGTAINATFIDDLPAAKITSGTLDNARINWESPGTIGSTTPSTGSFSTVTATTFSGSGASLTNLPAGNLTTGIVSTARYSAIADLVAEGAAGVDTTEVGYLNGVTSSIQTQITTNQTQIATKSPIASPTFTGTVIAPTISATTVTVSGDINSNSVGYETEGAYRFCKVNGTKTKVYTKYITGTLAVAATTNIAHGVTSGINKILNYRIITYNSGLTSYTEDNWGDYIAGNAYWVEVDDNNIVFNGVETNVQGQIYKIKIEYML